MRFFSKKLSYIRLECLVHIYFPYLLDGDGVAALHNVHISCLCTCTLSQYLSTPMCVLHTPACIPPAHSPGLAHGCTGQH